MKTILTLAVASFLAVLTLAQGQPSASEMDPDIAEMLSTNAPPPGFATRLDYIKSFKSEKDIIDAYHSGKINHDEAMLALSMDSVSPDDKSPMDTYGKVVDQDGQPVAGATVHGYLEFEDKDKEDKHDTTTDALGNFNFLGLHAKGLTLVVEKVGYEGSYRGRPSGYVPDPNNPVVLQMWKLKGAEPMNHATLHAYIPCDGAVTRFDLLTGKKNPNGGLFVSLTRNPLSIIKGKAFDWTLTLQITNGGFQAITNIYPNEAPADGYQSNMIFHYEANSTNWTPQIQPQLYFKGENGQVYGRMTLKVMADFQPPPTLFDAEIYANPNGSRNLEFDGSREIMR
jgi:hypothetical protein